MTNMKYRKDIERNLSVIDIGTLVTTCDEIFAIPKGSVGIIVDRSSIPSGYGNLNDRDTDTRSYIYHVLFARETPQWVHRWNLIVLT